jgi:hypothetical protein
VYCLCWCCIVAQAALEELMCPHGVAAVLPTLFEAMLAQKWQTNEGACKMVQVRHTAAHNASLGQLRGCCTPWCCTARDMVQGISMGRHELSGRQRRMYLYTAQRAQTHC